MHSIGPWEMTVITDALCDIDSGGRGNWKAIASVHANTLGCETVGSEEMESNARLIAAAPELLAACQMLLSEARDEAKALGFNWADVVGDDRVGYLGTPMAFHAIEKALGSAVQS